MLKDCRWEICPTAKLKQEFIERTDYKFKYYISNADFASVLIKNAAYIISSEITPYFNTPNSTINIESPDLDIEENEFKISLSNYNLDKAEPTQFLKLLSEIFHENVNIQSFRKIVNIALRGKGYSDGVLMYGNQQSITALFTIIERVLGSYFYECENTKVLYKTLVRKEIPNCCVLLFRNHTYPIDQYNWDTIIGNEYFPTTILNINKSVPFVAIKSPKLPCLKNAVSFKFYKTVNEYNLDDIINNEGGAILNWLINDIDFSMPELEDYVKEVEILTDDETIDVWLHCNCDYNDDTYIETPATGLYENYVKFMDARGLIAVSSRYFFLQLGNVFQKKRYSFGMVYIGIKIKE